MAEVKFKVWDQVQFKSWWPTMTIVEIELWLSKPNLCRRYVDKDYKQEWFPDESLMIYSIPSESAIYDQEYKD